MEVAVLVELKRLRVVGLYLRTMKGQHPLGGR
jgi:hypothetical protein